MYYPVINQIELQKLTLLAQVNDALLRAYKQVAWESQPLLNL